MAVNRDQHMFLIFMADEGGMIMDFYKRALELREETVSHRRWLHSHAEVGLHMPKGQAYVMEQLKGCGLDPHPCGH